VPGGGLITPDLCTTLCRLSSDTFRGLRSVGTAILGAGPAGLSAAYILARRGKPAEVFEADGRVGGIAKTVDFKGYRFDLGGHRFFTKLRPVQRLWEDMLGDDLLVRPRLSRIYYKGSFIAYPLRAKDVVKRLGYGESCLCGLSYAWNRLRRRANHDNYEAWVTTRFGQRLYDTFFSSYTEKVWGIPGSEITAEWAAQRIKNFSLFKALLGMTGLRRPHVTTLIESFHYPRLGPGQMWEELQRRIEGQGVAVRLNHRCVAVQHEHGHVSSIVLRTNGHEEEIAVDGVVSSIPLSELVLSLEPPPPPGIAAAARRLRYRDLVLVALVIEEEEPFPDNWIYLHDPGTRAGRVQNFGAWSPSMVRPGTTCLGLEYFCFEGDEIWEMPEEQIIELAKDELTRIGLIDATKVIDGVKVRVPRAYPMYDGDYMEAVNVLRGYLESFDNLVTCGRNGLHRYNNQDHSMWTAILATLNLTEGTSYDAWAVNTDAEYLEEGSIADDLLGVELVG
jgi:protoporphyrinogen oxidase